MLALPDIFEKRFGLSFGMFLAAGLSVRSVRRVSRTIRFRFSPVFDHPLPAHLYSAQHALPRAARVQLSNATSIAPPPVQKGLAPPLFPFRKPLLSKACLR
jgi:hypothetical protein